MIVRVMATWSALRDDKAGIKKELSVICQSGLKQIETKAKQLP